MLKLEAMIKIVLTVARHKTLARCGIFTPSVLSSSEDTFPAREKKDRWTCIF